MNPLLSQNKKLNLEKETQSSSSWNIDDNRLDLSCPHPGWFHDCVHVAHLVSVSQMLLLGFSHSSEEGEMFTGELLPVSDGFEDPRRVSHQ